MSTKMIKIEDNETLVDKGYLELLENNSEWLQCLEGAGVDNWDGIDYAKEMYTGDD